MATFRMRYVQAYEDRHGRMRYYYRRPGYPRVALPGVPGSVEFAEAYRDAAAQRPRKIGEDQTVPGSFSALIADYYEGAEYAKLKDITKRTYRNTLERFREAFGDAPVASLTPERLDVFLESFGDRTGARQSYRKVLSVILKRAMRRPSVYRLKQNPLEGVRIVRKAKKGFPPWSEADIAAYEARWPSGTRERLALALLLYTLQRRGDVVTMGRQHIKAGKIYVVQSKTDTRLGLPIVPELQRELDQLPAGQLTFLQTQYGQPFTPAGFTNWFRDAAREAGVLDRSPHGLRKTGSQRLAEAGCTPSMIMAVTGHKNLSEVTLYTASVDQERMAEEAIARTKVSTRKNPVRQKARNV